MSWARRRAFAALYLLGRGLESAATALRYAAAGLLDRATLQAAIIEEWRQFGIAQEASDDVSLFAWEDARFIDRDDRVLLIGCGTGRDLLALLDRGYRPDGLDLVPEAVERWIKLYEAERVDGEEFNAFAERAGAERFEAEVKELTLPAEFSLETMQQFIDWNRSSPYKVERGEGECAI